MSVSVHLSLFRDLLFEFNSGHHLSTTTVNTSILYFGSTDGTWQWGYSKDLGKNSSAITAM